MTVTKDDIEIDIDEMAQLFTRPGNNCYGFR
jgi:hypothetical protein